MRIKTFAQPKVRISIWSYADLWFRDLFRQLAILVAAPYDFGLPFGQHNRLVLAPPNRREWLPSSANPGAYARDSPMAYCAMSSGSRHFDSTDIWL